MSRKEKTKPELSYHARILAGWLMSGRILRAQIDNVEPLGDGLFQGFDQSYRWKE